MALLNKTHYKNIALYGPNSKSETYTTHARAQTHMHVCMFAHAHYPVASLPFSPLPKTAS
jgi:hypothetical protein